MSDARLDLLRRMAAAIVCAKHGKGEAMVCLARAAGCCVQRQRVIAAAKVHLERGSSGSSVIDDASPQGPTLPGEGA